MLIIINLKYYDSPYTSDTKWIFFASTCSNVNSSSTAIDGTATYYCEYGNTIKIYGSKGLKEQGINPLYEFSPEDNKLIYNESSFVLTMAKISDSVELPDTIIIKNPEIGMSTS